MFDQEDKMQPYILGQLTGSELEAFEKYMKDNPEFQEEVRSQMIINAAGGRIRDKEIKKRMRAIEDQINTKTNVNYKDFLRWAAVLLLAALPLYYFIAESSKSNQELYIGYFEPYPNVLGPTRDDQTIKIDGMIAYEAGDYGQAVNKLTITLSSNPQNDGIRLYLGISLMETGQLEEAIDVFKLIPGKSRFSNQSKWYTSLALLVQNNEKEATVLLEELERNSSYAEQAADLLGEISP